MSQDIIESWVEQAKHAGGAPPSASGGVKVIRRGDTQSRGKQIMEIAEKIRPWIMELFKNTRDENGMLLQPSQARGIALNVAQDIVKEHEQKTN